MHNDTDPFLFFALMGGAFAALGVLMVVGGTALRRRTRHVPGRVKGLWRLFVVGGGFVFLGGIFAVFGIAGLVR